MIQTLRKRLNRKDEGFTLIELMVVVLIIAILLAIAIPTYLGARSRAQNRAAESNLNTALTAEKTGFTDNQSYYGAVSALQSIEPSLQWVTTTPSKGTSQVEESSLESGNSVCLLAVSGSGNTYGVFDETSASGGWASPGTYYAAGTNVSCPSAAFTAGSSSGWYTSTSGAGW